MEIFDYKNQNLRLQETCTLKFKNARMVKQPLRTEWCLDEDQDIPGLQSDNRDNHDKSGLGDFSYFSTSCTVGGGGGGGGGREVDNPIGPGNPGILDQPSGNSIILHSRTQFIFWKSIDNDLILRVDLWIPTIRFLLC